MKVLFSKSHEETLEWGRKIGKLLAPGDIVTLNGPLGAGKTTLAKGVALALGIKEEVTSPTYTIVSVYEGKMTLYHMDMYRVEGCEDFEMLGLNDYLYGTGLSLVEWSEKVASELPHDCLGITLNIQEDGSRRITLKGLEL